MTESSSGPGQTKQREEAVPGLLKDTLKSLGALVANVTVLTALLVYFGWVRAEEHAAGLGIDESLLGMTVREYVLRSVRPVIVMVVAICVCGLLWLSAEPYVRRAVRPRPEGGRRPWWGTGLAALLGLSWLVLPLVVRLLGEFRPVLATILFPAAIGAGILLWSWSRSERGSGADPPARRTTRAVLTWTLVVVCLFWSATNFAQNLGRNLAAGFADTIALRPAVVVYSSARLHLDGPGVVEQTMASEAGDTFSYTGLRFVEHTGGNYFLVSEGWTPTYGVFFVLPDDSAGTRFEFVRGAP
jgi:hypothetical protein